MKRTHNIFAEYSADHTKRGAVHMRYTQYTDVAHAHTTQGGGVGHTRGARTHGRTTYHTYPEKSP